MKRIAIAAGVLLALAGVAIARPGGGGSYSGGGGHGSSSGGGGGGGLLELLYWLLRLLIEVPQIGVPLVCLVIGYFVWSAIKQHRNKDWDSGPPVALSPAVTLDDMLVIDPDFSPVLFEDFAFRLFSTAQRARHSSETLDTVAPYVSNEARFALQTRPPPATPVLSVVIGAMRVVRVGVPNPLEPDEDWAFIEVEFEANVTTAKHTYYSVEMWRFGRMANVHSKPPADRSFPCPNCGAPWASSETGTQKCASCGEIVDNGRFDWVVDLIKLRSMDERPPTLAEDVKERGTDLETYRQSDVDAKLGQLFASDPALTEAALLQRLGLIYGQLNTAWAANDLTPARGVVSDGLYDYLAYWVEAYKQQDLRNELRNMRITQHTIAKVTRDRWYDAVTIRIWGTGLDYTVKISDGALVTGSKRSERAYSEYWTLIRSATRKGATVTEPKCSNCGGALSITAAGACSFCGQHVTSGEFDWVLSKIEQDDSYRG